MPWLPRRMFNEWPHDATDLVVADVIRLYENGFAGARYDANALDAFKASQLYPDGDAAAHQFGLAGSGAGRLVMPWVLVQEMFPGCWPGPAQGRGDCVSHGVRCGGLTTMACDIFAGTPDETTGKPEEKPEVPEEGIRNGVLSSEAFYWWRGYNGDGWMCPSAARVATQTSGLFPRKNYPELGVDLTRYSANLAGKYGAQRPPESIKIEGGKHLAHQATELSSHEAIRDFLFNGYGCFDCGDEGYSDTRDEWGVSRLQGSWAHSMGRIGVDDRDVIKQKYGEPLHLELNSWAKWNHGPRDVYQSAALVPQAKKDLWTRLGIVNASTGNIMIPEGAFWMKWSHCRNREVFSFSGVNGWPAKVLPDINYI